MFILAADHRADRGTVHRKITWIGIKTKKPPAHKAGGFFIASLRAKNQSNKNHHLADKLSARFNFLKQKVSSKNKKERGVLNHPTPLNHPFLTFAV